MADHDDTILAGAEDAALSAALSGVLEPMPSDAKRAVRGRVLAYAVASRAPRHVARIAATAVLATTLLGGASYAVAAAGPGDTLFPVRQAAASAAASVGRALSGAAAWPAPIAPPKADTSDATIDPGPSAANAVHGVGTAGDAPAAGAAVRSGAKSQTHANAPSQAGQKKRSGTNKKPATNGHATDVPKSNGGGGSAASQAEKPLSASESAHGKDAAAEPGAAGAARH